MINRVAIEGIDGSGKSTVARELAHVFESEDLQASVYAPFRLANQELGEDIYPLWRKSKTAKAAITVLKKVLAECETEASDNKDDIVIYDRHWMTVFTEIPYDPELFEAWGDTFVPAALLKVDPRTATARQGNDRNMPWAGQRSQWHYSLSYAHLADDHFDNMLGIYRSDNDVRPLTIARAIQSDMYYRR